MHRRTVLSGLAGFAVAGIVGSDISNAAVPFTSDNPAQLDANITMRRIDVHAHYLPGRYRKEALEAGHAHPDGMPALPEWSVPKALDVMDRCGIATAMLSISSPGVHFGDDAKARSLCRAVNEEGANAVNAYPERFGLFASLPLPNVDASLRELEYAMDVLKADGIVIESNQHGIYPGEERLDPIFAELNRRKAVLFIHPTSPNCPCCQSLSMGYPAPMIEFLFETSRAITNMIIKGTFDRFPDIRFIIPHAGATIPSLLERIIGFSSVLSLSKPLDAEHVYSLVRKLHFDLAGFPIPHQLDLLLQISDPQKILYGSDWPFTPESTVLKRSKSIDCTSLLSPELRQRILRDNALTLFPRLA
jgi:predicted TIM-barrel fold metal-dependent hydrolase